MPCGPLSLQGEGWGEGTESAERTEFIWEPATLSLTLSLKGEGTIRACGGTCASR